MNLGKALVDLATVPVRVGLVATEAGLQFAKQQLEAARPGYHPITTTSVERVIAEARPAPGSGTPVPAEAIDAPAAAPEAAPAPEVDMPAADGDPTRPAPVGR